MTMPGFDKRVDENFKIREKFHKMAAKTLKKVKKKKIDLFVGIHVRRTDYTEYEEVQNWVPVKASYYLEAMDLYRNYYSNHKLVFFVISDDIEWCKKNIGGKKSKDIVFASNQNLEETTSIGHDLALMTKMN